jgi:hypothetical protein
MQLSDLKIMSYSLGEIRGELVLLDRVPGPAGDRWAIRAWGYCLNRDGKWDYEPMPSSRTDAFFARCRYATPEEALQAWARREGPA